MYLFLDTWRGAVFNLGDFRRLEKDIIIESNYSRLVNVEHCPSKAYLKLEEISRV